MSKYIPNRRGTPTRIGVKAQKRIMQAYYEQQLKALEESKAKAATEAPGEIKEERKDEN